MKYFVFTCFFFAFKSYTFSQQKPVEEHYHFDGPLVKYSVYDVRFETPFLGYLTIGNRRVEKYGDRHFQFYSIKSGDTLKTYDVQGKGDTVLVQTHFLKFETPGLGIEFQGKTSGETVNVNELKDWYFNVPIPSTSVDGSLILDSIYIKFYKNCKLVERNFKIKERDLKEFKSEEEMLSFCGGCVPKKITDEIVDSKSELIIVTARISPEFPVEEIPPAVFYLTY